VVEVAEAARVVLVPVDDGTDPAWARAREVAIDLASRSSARLVLLDRADTTYADTPRVHELSREEAVELDRPYLVTQIDEAEAAGLSATAFQHSLPGSEALRDAIDEVHADLVVVPADLDRPRPLERTKAGDAADRADRATPTSVQLVSVSADGSVSLVQ
jgi:nucleotide-binding universal stress UspA family protein